MTTGGSIGSRFCMALALIVVALAPPARSGLAQDAEGGAVAHDLQQQFFAALNRGDIEAVLATFADNGSYQGSGPACERLACIGSAAIRGEIQRQIAAHAHYTSGQAELQDHKLVVPFQASADDIRFLGAERIVGTLSFESSGARLSRVTLALDADDEQTAQFHAAIRAMAERGAASPVASQLNEDGRKSVSVEQNKATSRRLYDELFNKGNLAVVDEVLGGNFVLHPASGPPVAGGAAMKRFEILARIAFPNQEVVLEDQIAEGDRVVSRWTIRGTNSGQFDLPTMGSFGPSNRDVNLAEIRIDRFADGKIVESWALWDRLGMLRQLGFAEDPTAVDQGVSPAR